MASLDNLPRRERNNRSKLEQQLSPHYYFSTTFFSKVCNQLGETSEGQVNYLLKVLKDTDSGLNTQVGYPYVFSKEDLFSTLLLNWECKNSCMAFGYTCWDDIIIAFNEK